MSQTKPHSARWFCKNSDLRSSQFSCLKTLTLLVGKKMCSWFTETRHTRGVILSLIFRGITRVLSSRVQASQNMCVWCSCSASCPLRRWHTKFYSPPLTGWCSVLSCAAGEVLGDVFEVSRIRREDYEFHKGKSEYEDILQCNNLPSSGTPRGHQTPAAFLIMASGLDKVLTASHPTVLSRTEKSAVI